MVSEGEIRPDSDRIKALYELPPPQTKKRIKRNSGIVFLLLSMDFFFFFFFYLYIYPPDSQESDGGAIHRISNYPDLLPEMPRYCCPLVI